MVYRSAEGSKGRKTFVHTKPAAFLARAAAVTRRRAALDGGRIVLRQRRLKPQAYNHHNHQAIHQQRDRCFWRVEPKLKTRC